MQLVIKAGCCKPAATPLKAKGLTVPWSQTVDLLLSEKFARLCCKSVVGMAEGARVLKHASANINDRGRSILSCLG